MHPSTSPAPLQTPRSSPPRSTHRPAARHPVARTVLGHNVNELAMTTLKNGEWHTLYLQGGPTVAFYYFQCFVTHGGKKKFTTRNIVSACPSLMSRTICRYLKLYKNFEFTNFVNNVGNQRWLLNIWILFKYLQPKDKNQYSHSYRQSKNYAKEKTEH